MKRFIAAGAALLASATLAYGISTTQIWMGTANVSATDPLPITGTITATTTPGVVGNGTAATAQRVTVASDSTGVIGLNAGTAIVGKVGIDQTTDGTTNHVYADIAKVAGAAVATGHGTASGSVRVELPTDGTGKVGLNAGSAIIGNVGIDQTTSGTTNAVVPLATENHVGEVGNNQITITVAQTVTASSAYTAGNAVGGLITFPLAARVSGSAGAAGTSGLMQSVTVNSKSAQATQMDLVLFSANPTGSTCTDKTALSVAVADFDKVIGTAHITDWTALGTPSVGQSQNLAMPYALASSTTLYGCLVTRATPTFTATTDISASLRVIRN